MKFKKTLMTCALAALSIITVNSVQASSNSVQDVIDETYVQPDYVLGYSLSDDPTLLGRPEGFKITIKDLRLSNGAGFVVAYAGDIMIMPGLPKVPAANKIDVDNNGVVSGLFY